MRTTRLTRPRSLRCVVGTGIAAVLATVPAILVGSGVLIWHPEVELTLLLVATAAVLSISCVLSYNRYRLELYVRTTHQRTRVELDRHAERIERLLAELPTVVRQYGEQMYQNGYDHREQDAPIEVPRQLCRPHAKTLD